MAAARYTPESPEALSACLAELAAAGERVRVEGLGSRRHLGAPWGGAVLSTEKLRGIVRYEPEELILVARAGTPMAELEAVLTEAGQFFAFEPGAGGTLGGVIANNVAGSRRPWAGAARDHILGASACDGRGRAFKCGGAVVKNVTGYDLARGLAGSRGTLAVMHEITMKVLPAPPASRTLRFEGEQLERGRSLNATAVAWRPEAGATFVRFEGPEVALDALCGAEAGAETLAPDDANTLWAEISSFGTDAEHLWRVSLPPAAGTALLERVEATRTLADWGGALVWLEVNAVSVESAQQLREVARALGGHATLWRAPANVRETVPTHHPAPPEVAGLEARLRSQFDPDQVFY